MPEEGVKRDPFTAIMLWVFFSVVSGGILLICFSFLFSALLDKPFPLQYVLSHEKLLIVAVAIAGGAFSDLSIGPQAAHDTLSTILVILCVSSLVCSCFLLGCSLAINVGGSNWHVSRDLVFWFSVVCVALAVSSGTLSKWRNR